MTVKEKNAVKTLLRLYKEDTIGEEELMELIECVAEKPMNTYYYPWSVGSETEKPLTPQYTTTTVGYAELS